MKMFTFSSEVKKSSLGRTRDSSTVSSDGLVDPFPVVSHISEDGVRSLAGQSVADVSDEDMLAIDDSSEGTTAVSLQ